MTDCDRLTLVQAADLAGDLNEICGDLFHGRGKHARKAAARVAKIAGRSWPYFEGTCTFYAGLIGENLRTAFDQQARALGIPVEHTERLFALGGIHSHEPPVIRNVKQIATASANADVDTVTALIGTLEHYTPEDRSEALATLVTIAISTHHSWCAGGRA
ncbi:hypothetical protein [Microbacterium sp.]|uniref:hypothetical protein n=1 Tax=Microbacterium sp. TaxID=51671 RepID=UPI003F6EC85A